jgi:hypothetical protein
LKFGIKESTVKWKGTVGIRNKKCVYNFHRQKSLKLCDLEGSFDGITILEYFADHSWFRSSVKAQHMFFQSK